MRYTEAKCRLCRREGVKLFLKGARCYTQKCGVTRKNEVPGKYGKNSRSKKTEYHTQLRAKQKAKRIYGLTEKQFAGYVAKATKMEGNTGENFTRLLEMRLDNALYRAGFAPSRAAARQLVAHGALRRDGQRASIPSMQVKAGETYAIKDTLKESPLFEGFAKKKSEAPDWLKADLAKHRFTVVSAPVADQALAEIDVQTIIEFYSR